MSEKPSAAEQASQDEAVSTRTGVKRPLVPVVLALMVGLGGGRLGVAPPQNLGARRVNHPSGNPVGVMALGRSAEMRKASIALHCICSPLRKILTSKI
jgi:hypothetical protein